MKICSAKSEGAGGVVSNQKGSGEPSDFQRSEKYLPFYCSMLWVVSGEMPYSSTDPSFSTFPLLDFPKNPWSPAPVSSDFVLAASIAALPQIRLIYEVFVVFNHASFAWIHLLSAASPAPISSTSDSILLPSNPSHLLHLSTPSHGWRRGSCSGSPFQWEYPPRFATPHCSAWSVWIFHHHSLSHCPNDDFTRSSALFPPTKDEPLDTSFPPQAFPRTASRTTMWHSRSSWAGGCLPFPRQHRSTTPSSHRSWRWLQRQLCRLRRRHR